MENTFNKEQKLFLEDLIKEMAYDSRKIKKQSDAKSQANKVSIGRKLNLLYYLRYPWGRELECVIYSKDEVKFFNYVEKTLMVMQ